MINHKLYLDILKQELVPAMGCTEPVAVAYAAALVREQLGGIPDRVSAQICGNIIKNVKSVIVPNTGGMKGLKASIAVGILGGDVRSELEVIAGVGEDVIRALPSYIENTPIEIEPAHTPFKLDIDITAERGADTARVRIVNYHTNVVRIEKNGEIIKDIPTEATMQEDALYNLEKQMCLHDILTFAAEADLDEVRSLLEQQISYNMAIAEEGMKNSYGANVGKTYLKTFGDQTIVKAAAYAAAGSDARMNGCEMPVITLSGSGNQGITASVPVVVYARDLGKTEEEMFRALLVADLCAVHQKTEIGRLSAFCGAVNAGCGAACGIAYLTGAGEEEIAKTLTNTLAISAGIVCDGAKSSCAAKIVISLQTGLLGYRMQHAGEAFKGGDGLLGEDVEKTIANIGRLGRYGMAETDKEILKIMTEEN